MYILFLPGGRYEVSQFFGAGIIFDWYLMLSPLDPDASRLITELKSWAMGYVSGQYPGHAMRRPGMHEHP